MLCLSTFLLLGFANPQKVQGSVKTDASATPAPVTVNTLVSLEAAAAQLIPPESIPKVSMRPFSLAGDSQIGKILGSVSPRIWSSEWAIANQRSTPRSTLRSTRHSTLAGRFRGVGFPDIRTYPRQKRSPFDAPGPWAPLVAWRVVTGEDEGIEPIASVRCMGLSPQAVARRADRYREMIYTYADQYDVSRHLVKAVITEESCFNNKARSHVGAQGLMQLMPDTARWLKVEDPHDPAQNVRAGVRYLASLRKEFDSLELALAAYNAGPGNVRRYNGVPPFAETQAYVLKVQANYRRYRAADSMLLPVDDLFVTTELFDSNVP